MRSARTPARLALVVVLMVASASALADRQERNDGRLARSDIKEPLFRMRPPSLESWQPVYAATSAEAHAARLQSERSDGLVVVARGFNAPVFKSRRAASVTGRVRRGNVVSVLEEGPRCGGGRGRWYEVEGGGWVCTARDFAEVTLPLDVPIDLPLDAGQQLQPEVHEALPFRYARVIEPGAPRWSRIPTPEEERRGAGGALVEQMVGDFFLALAAEVKDDGRTFWRTVEGEYVRAEHLELRDTPPLVGERIDDALERPLAFVYGEEPAPLACLRGGHLEECGVAEKHARFRITQRLEHDGEGWLVSDEGLAVPERRLRVVERKARPSRVGPGDKWVHIELSRQTLVAYEGDRPVYATLIASGKPSHATPTGLYRVQRKYLSKTMRGKDPKEGIYHVEEVPWTLYYNRGWAVHGAYWHNTFGDVRSHGCTNVAPADARWLYHWATLDVPDGWHAVVGRRGTWFWFTRDRG